MFGLKVLYLSSSNQEIHKKFIFRWKIKTVNRPTKNDDISSEVKSEIQEKLPLDVVNNYFSIGADAKIALDFHHARRMFFLNWD